ncbi:MAG: hypothetical protein ACE5HP_11880 [Gemmatimonadota bacterium]
MPGELDFEEELRAGSRGTSTAGTGGSSRRRRRGGLLLFLLGVGVGVAGTLLTPRLGGDYLPEAVRPAEVEVTGEVLGKRLEEERLLLTLETPAGAILATFRRRVPEIDLLVEAGDTVTLGLRRYEPFVEDPAVNGVRKGRRSDDAEAARPSIDERPEEAEPSPETEADSGSGAER